MSRDDTTSSSSISNVAPTHISQLTSLAAIGIPPRRYIEWAKALPHCRVGKLIIVEASIARAALAAGPVQDAG